MTRADTPASARLPAEVLAMMRKGVSVIVASRDAHLKPSLMRAVGSRVSDDGREVTVFLSRPQSRQLIQDIAASGHVAAVFSQPSTHRTVQLKARQARLRGAEAGDEAALAAYLASMEEEILAVGFPPEVTRNMLAHELLDVVAVTFSPEEAFDQTPGPRAGTRLETGA